VRALADRILELSPNGHVVVHHDSTGADPPWEGAPPSRVHTIDPVAVKWGGWSIVEASLRLVRFAADELAADWFVFLSGDDRPIVDLARWEDRVREDAIDGIVEATRITKRPVLGRRPTREDLNYARYMYRWRAVPAVRNAAGQTAVEFTRRISRWAQPLFKIERTPRREEWMLGFPRRSRSLPGGLALYIGPQWVSFGRRAAKALLDADPALVDWYRETWIPDQSFFQTVLYNEPSLTMRNAPVTFVPKQGIRPGPGGWMLLRTGDLEDLRQSGCAFARKFDAEIEPEILRVVDEAIDASRERA